MIPTSKGNQTTPYFIFSFFYTSARELGWEYEFLFSPDLKHSLSMTEHPANTSCSKTLSS
jgi:hypothetical protein